MKTIVQIPRMLCLWGLLAGANTVFAQTFEIENSGDYGNSHDNYPSSNAFDGDSTFSSRWAATFDGGSANLWADFGSVQRIDNVGISWGRGDERSYEFVIRARSGTSGSWTRIYRGDSSGTTEGIENYNVDDFDARQVRIKITSNSAGSNWADVTELEVYGTAGPSDTPTSDPETSFAIPGVIQVEDFSDYSDSESSNRGGAYRNTGVDIQECSDANCGYNIGWTVKGEWLEYPISVSDSDNYEARVRVASNRTTGALSFDIDGKQVSDTLAIASTSGWQNWKTKSVDLGAIKAGDHTLRLNIEGSNFNVNWIEIVSTDSEDEGDPTDDEEFGLDASAEPWENFDLTRWALDTPAPRNDDACRSERTWDHNWDDNNPLDSSSKPFFFTHSDGGMRFVTRMDGETTSTSCDDGYVRSELREMLRAGDQSIDDTGVTRNNWKLGYQPGNDSNWGGVNGQLDATLRVNQVTTSGSSSQVGRIIIGQIHAGSDEPLRLYYRKRSGQSKGCISFSHEISEGPNVNYYLIGDKDCTSGPDNGIELDELFSYSIINAEEDITVIIRRGDKDGSVIAQETIDMNVLESGYDRSDEWVYFKAGAYTQNDSGKDSDGDIATFYRLSASHD